MDQSSSRAASLSRPDRESETEEGAASATRVRSGPRLWELDDIGPDVQRNKDTSCQKGQKRRMTCARLRLHGPERIQIPKEVPRDACGQHRPRGEEKQIGERRQILLRGRKRRDCMKEQHQTV